jgi:hypothetical protein
MKYIFRLKKYMKLTDEKIAENERLWEEENRNSSLKKKPLPSCMEIGIGKEHIKKYLRCDCCGFLAVISTKDDETGIDCPFCVKVQCDEGQFLLISAEAFKKDADLSL